MLYFSSLLTLIPKYKPSAQALFPALERHGEAFSLMENTKDIWARDYMPVKTKSGRYISFRYAPCYLKDEPWLRTDFRETIAPQFAFPVTYSDINLDGGNVVFSPSREKAIISDRIFSENAHRDKDELAAELAATLEAQIIIIESLRSDFTGHADGMLRFLSEDTVLINKTELRNGLEQRQARKLKALGFQVIEFPFYQCGGISAVGSYLNYLETAGHIFLPVFGSDTNAAAVSMASGIFQKEVVPVESNSIAKDGGVLNCISWED